MNSPASSDDEHVERVLDVIRGQVVTVAPRQAVTQGEHPGDRPVGVLGDLGFLGQELGEPRGVGGDAVQALPQGLAQPGRDAQVVLRVVEVQVGRPCSCAHTDVPPAAPAGVEPSVPGVVPSVPGVVPSVPGVVPSVSGAAARATGLGALGNDVGGVGFGGGVVVVAASGEGE